MTTDKWRIYCNTESKWTYGWSSSKPTSCFTNGSHSVNLNSQSIIVDGIVKEDSSIVINQNTITGINVQSIGGTQESNYKNTIRGLIQENGLFIKCGGDAGTNALHAEDANGVVLMHVDSNTGFVGIKTATPSTDLEINGAITSKRSNIIKTDHTISTSHGLSVNDTMIYNYTASTNNDVVKLPSGTTLPSGWSIVLINNPSSTASLDIQNFDGTSLATLAVNKQTEFTIIDTGTSAGTWIESQVGPQGPAGSGDISWQGSWNSAITYTVNQAVYHPSTGSSYICILGHTNFEPPNSTYWDLMISPVSSTYANVISGHILNSNINNQTYGRVATMIYPGFNNIGTIQKIDIISYMQETVTNYSVRVMDVNNQLVLAENVFTNTEESINTLTPLSNVPSGTVILELQAKRTGGGHIYINGFLIYI